ncbi:MAG: hypothetical protein OXF27_06325 [Acidobacteria bacterium]|nr:hypothetical protein [Acidobacteriota bacterium]
MNRTRITALWLLLCIAFLVNVIVVSSFAFGVVGFMYSLIGSQLPLFFLLRRAQRIFDEEAARDE